MLAAPFRVVLDANVLYPFTLRDTLLRAAVEDLYQVYWSAEILDEVVRNLRANGVMQEAQARHLLDRMAAAFPEACATGYEDLIASMRVHPKDRHVAAVAVLVGAQVIVTSNLKDFRDLPPALEAKSPDDFLCDLLTALAKTVPTFAEEVRAYLRA